MHRAQRPAATARTVASLPAGLPGAPCPAGATGGSDADQMRSTKGGSPGGWCEETRSGSPVRHASGRRFVSQRLAAWGQAPAAGDTPRSLRVAGGCPVPVSAGCGAQQADPDRSDAHAPSGAAQQRACASAPGAGHSAATRSAESRAAARRRSAGDIAIGNRGGTDPASLRPLCGTLADRVKVPRTSDGGGTRPSLRPSPAVGGASLHGRRSGGGAELRRERSTPARRARRCCQRRCKI
jgi:hypothetical protein